MRYIDIKANDKTFHVSRLALGTFGYGTDMFVPADISYQLMDRYIEAGGNLLDSARVYMNGLSEGFLGEYIEDRKIRDRILISTKGGHPPHGDYFHKDLSMVDDYTACRLTYDDLRSDLDASLSAFRTDYIDMYWLHKDCESCPVEVIVEAVNRLLESGEIGAIGCSNWKTSRIEEANRYAKEHGMKGFELSQIQWSLAQADPSTEDFTSHLDMCMTDDQYKWYLKENMPVFAWGSQASAVFTRVFNNGWDSLSDELKRKFGSEDNKKRFERLKAFCEEKNVSISQAALAYVTCNALPGVALIGCKKMYQLEDSLSAADLDFSPEEVQALHDLD